MNQNQKNNMNKDQEIKEIEEQQRELADKLKALREGPKPQCGDVWLSDNGFYIIQDDPKTDYTHLSGVLVSANRQGWSPSHGDVPDFNIFDLDKTHISKKTLLEWRDDDGDGLMTGCWSCSFKGFVMSLLVED